MHTISIKRAYEAAAETDGYRVLVDRLWPRGRTKDQLALAQWSKDWAPSSALRKWFDHRPDRFVEFSRRYVSELQANSSIRDALNSMPKKHITLVYGAKDPDINHAVVLAKFLEQHRE